MARLHLLLTLMAVALGGVTACGGGGTGYADPGGEVTADDDGSAVTTIASLSDVPSTGEPTLSEHGAGEEETQVPVEGEFFDYVIESVMDDYDVTAEVAHDMLEAQGRLGDYGDVVRHEVGYAGFMLVNEPPDVSGVLAVTPGSSITVPPGLPVTVIEARIAERDHLEIDEALVEAFQEAGFPEIGATTYDPFEDVVIVWSSPESSHTPPSPSQAQAVIVEVLGDEFGDVGVRFDSILTVDF